MKFIIKNKFLLLFFYLIIWSIYIILMFAIEKTSGFELNYDFIETNGTKQPTLSSLNYGNETILIGCIDRFNKTTPPIVNSQGKSFCRFMNIMMPPNEHLMIFEKLYGDNLTMIANRLTLINFESGFNPHAISPTNDYGYIQINNGPWSLGLIEEVLHWLDNRFETHKNQLCLGTLKLNEHDYDNIMRCLYMRHNGQRRLNNSYSNRLIAGRNYYINYMNEKLKEKEIKYSIIYGTP